jgi:hypothetical protein
MQFTSQIIGLVIMLVSAGWYLYYADGVELKGVL